MFNNLILKIKKTRIILYSVILFLLYDIGYDFITLHYLLQLLVTKENQKIY